MPRKIENLLTTGLPAKIYLLCYLNPETGYTLAKKIYDVKEGIPPTSKIYPWITRMIKEGYLKKTDDKYQAEIAPLLLQLNTILKKKGKPLDHSELLILGGVLISSKFKQLVAIDHNANGTNALKTIISQLSISASVRLNQRKFGSEAERKDPLEVYKEMSKGRFKSDQPYTKGLSVEEYFYYYAKMVEETKFDIPFPDNFDEGIKGILDTLRERFNGIIPQYSKGLTENFKAQIYAVLYATALFALVPTQMLQKLEDLDDEGKARGLGLALVGVYPKEANGK